VEQLLLYVVTFVGFFGFVLGILSFVVPYLQSRGLALPFALPFFNGAPGEDDEFEDEYEDDDPDFRSFTDAAFGEPQGAAFVRGPAPAGRPAPAVEAAEPLPAPALAAEATAEDEQAGLWLEEAEGAAVEPSSGAPEDGAELEATALTEGEAEAAPEAEPAVVSVAAAMGSAADDMMALFQEGGESGKQVQAWRQDLGDTTLEEVLQQARELRHLLSATNKGRRNAA